MIISCNVIARTKKHSRSIKEIEEYIEEYFESIHEKPAHVCNVCEIFLFQKEMHSMNKTIFQTYYGLTTTSRVNEIKIDKKNCRSCYSPLLNSKLPKFVTPVHIW